MPLRTHLILAVTLLAGTAVAPAQQTALLGQWHCQTPRGAATLAFGGNGDFFNGDTTQYRHHVSGDTLGIANPDGTRTHCRRSGGATGGFTQGGAAGSAANGLLQGTRCGWSGNVRRRYRRRAATVRQAICR